VPLDVLCAGAVKGLVLALETPFGADHRGASIDARFGAVGAMRDALRAGAPCDVLVLTEAMLETLEQSGATVAGTRAAIGRVHTGIAILDGARPPDIASSAALRQTLLEASALYFPDAERSTAGAHVAATLRRLGIEAALAPRCRMFANGATAMQELAASGDADALGCTQVTEILYTPGIALVGALPTEFELVTVYSAAVASRARDTALARNFIALLTGSASAALRRRGGFEIEQSS
jgi:molybdate transport system substrate-binding protein